MIDFKSKLGRKALRHLKQEYFVWLTTVDAKNTPQPRPVWFTLEGDSIVIYSQPGAYKLKHIVNNPYVSLHFNTPDAKGEDDVIVFHGKAKIEARGEAANKNNIYMRKYRTGIKGLDSTPQQFAEEYSTLVRIKLLSLRGW
ncbi:MAG: TIGR03667 family PPOX class F420-dependent oxidoreductase [Anaerolineales bacterium]|nr:TIGR03667 family PPOX class F420-dependent oxidoreductase [Anaerolineales bacterium]MCB9111051.1 TIGR03667 family PPOX class F420-dependent oxidoreductase [Anaerolineales bacterium]